MFRTIVAVVVVALFAPTVASAQTPLTRAQVRAAQRALHLPADGHIGPRTRRAIRRYERAHDLPVDGRLFPAVLKALGVDVTSPAPAPAPSGNVSEAVDAAQSAVGTPYASGGTTKSGFDCSGLTQWAFKQAGIRIGRSSFDQYKEGDAVKRSDIQAGDLVFFDTAGSGASHVGIATGPDTVISATTRGVMEHDSDDDYWGGHYVGARRLGDSAPAGPTGPTGPTSPTGGSGGAGA